MKIRRMGGALGVCAATALLLASPAGAAQPEVYLGNAAATALGVTLNGQALTFGVSNASIDSTLHSVAKGAGAAAVSQSATDAEVTGNNHSVAKPRSCATPTIPIPAVTLGLACSDSTASVSNNQPAATSDGSIASVDLDASQVTNGPLAPVTQPAATAIQTALGLIGGKTPLAPVTSVAQQLLNTITTTKTLHAEIGASTSEITTDGSKVTSLATANGATLQLFPAPAITGVNTALITIQVSGASASSTYDRATGKSAAAQPDATIVTVTVANIPGLPAIPPRKVSPGQSVTILAGTPLESTIWVAKGTTVTNPDGSVGSVAEGVRLQLAKQSSGAYLLDLELAHAEAGVNGSPAVATPAPAAATPTAPVNLPRTGGQPWMAELGAAVLIVALAGRRVLARAKAD
jgi:hypothetical protein